MGAFWVRPEVNSKSAAQTAVVEASAGAVVGQVIDVS